MELIVVEVAREEAWITIVNWIAVVVVAAAEIVVIIVNAKISIGLVVNSDARCTNSSSESNNESRGLVDTTDLETLMTGTF